MKKKGQLLLSRVRIKIPKFIKSRNSTILSGRASASHRTLGLCCALLRVPELAGLALLERRHLHSRAAAILYRASAQLLPAVLLSFNSRPPFLTSFPILYNFNASVGQLVTPLTCLSNVSCHSFTTTISVHYSKSLVLTPFLILMSLAT